MDPIGATQLKDLLKEWIRPFYLKGFYFHFRPEAKPNQWDTCWQFPVVDLLSPQPPPQPGKPDILFLPMTDWHTRTQRAQHFARQLARLGHRCFYLNPNLGREFPLPAIVSPGVTVCKLENNIWELHVALPREPVYHHRLLTPAESRHLAARLIEALQAFHSCNPIILTQFPLWNPVVAVIKTHFRGSICVYDCHDLLGGFSRMAAEIVAAETALLEKAEIVLFSAKSLLEEKLQQMPWLAGNSLIVRNGVDPNHFQWRRDSHHQVVGYAGSLDEWFDVDAVEQAARALPDANFVFLGRIEDRKVLRLEQLPNVRFYGEIPYSNLPSYLAEFDVALIPFLVTPLTIATNPIKLYEYFSCGHPVVSSPLPEVAAYDDLVYLAGSTSEFVEKVRLALAEDDEALRLRRRDVAQHESWQARGEQLSDLFSPSQE